jgi:hypothetical protein
MKTAEIIKNALKNSYSYTAYKDLINQLYAEGKTTGFIQTDAFLDYTKLGIRRTKRWDKTAKISKDDLTQLQKLEKPQTWVVISEAWCGDAAHALPIIAKLADANSKIDLKIVLRDENEALMDLFLTNGGRSIPKLISFSTSENQVLFTWGPRPEGAIKLIEDSKAKYGQITSEAKEALQMWFNKDKGQQIASEITQLATR